MCEAPLNALHYRVRSAHSTAAAFTHVVFTSDGLGHVLVVCVPHGTPLGSGEDSGCVESPQIPSCMGHSPPEDSGCAEATEPTDSELPLWDGNGPQSKFTHTNTHTRLWFTIPNHKVRTHGTQEIFLPGEQVFEVIPYKL